MMLGWLRRRRTAREVLSTLVDADARNLAAQYGDRAYCVARDRIRDEREGRIVDAGRPVGHWTAVKIKVAALTGREVGVDTATRYLDER